MAVEEGRRQLDDLRQGKTARGVWSASQLVSREEPPKNVPEQVLQQAFRMDVSKLPAYAGVDSPRGYVLLRVSRIQEAGEIPPEKAKALAEQLRLMQGQEVMAAYLASLRQRAGVKINQAQIEKKQ